MFYCLDWQLCEAHNLNLARYTAFCENVTKSSPIQLQMGLLFITPVLQRSSKGSENDPFLIGEAMSGLHCHMELSIHTSQTI